MTRRTNARVAGILFLLYIATGIASMVLFARASQGEDTAAMLASIGRHATMVRFTVVLSLATFVYAVGLGVTLYALTRDVDADLALFALCCRVGEGIIGTVAATRTLSLVAIATAGTAAAPENAAATRALGGLLFQQGGWTGSLSAACFAAGSTVFAYLLLRGRSIPVWLAWLGVTASAMLVVAIPLQLVGGLPGAAAFGVWVPMAAFEIVLAAWLIVRGTVPQQHPITGSVLS